MQELKGRLLEKAVAGLTALWAQRQRPRIEAKLCFLAAGLDCISPFPALKRGKYESSPHRAVECMELLTVNKHTALWNPFLQCYCVRSEEGPLPLTFSFDNSIARFQDHWKLTFLLSVLCHLCLDMFTLPSENILGVLPLRNIYSLPHIVLHIINCLNVQIISLK